MPSGGLTVVTAFSGFFEVLLKYAAQGTDFVFGGMSSQGLAFIFLGVLCPIVFISALIGILQHLENPAAADQDRWHRCSPKLTAWASWSHLMPSAR